MDDKEYREKAKLLKKAYTEIKEVCEKHSGFDEFEFRDIPEMLAKAKNHLQIIDWYEKYNIKIGHNFVLHERTSTRIDDHRCFLKFIDDEMCAKELQGRYILCSDNKKQPQDGWYFRIYFPTGAFIFGNDYAEQKPLFNSFFNELKSYSPDYSDTRNNSLYWKVENCTEIYNKFDEILEKYKEKNRSELNERKAKKLRAELDKIEKELKA